jgi:two-component sensor histidine kinase
LSFIRDKNGKVFSIKNSMKFIAESSNVPTYCSWGFQPDTGILGGNILSGYKQGEISALVARKLLVDESVKSIPTIQQAPLVYKFDYKALDRFNIDQHSIPENSIIYNKPFSFFEEYWTLILITLFIGLSLVLFIILLSMNIVRRKKAEAGLQEAHDNLDQQVKIRTDELMKSHELLEEEITERKQAEEKVKTSLKEKETLLHEIHHRVKNNMTVISSLLKLQAGQVNNDEAKTALMDSQNRVQSMSSIHETLYQSDNLSTVDMKTYLSSLASAIALNYSIGSKVNLLVESKNVLIGAKQASPVGLIVNELITNSFKYAFPDNQEGEIKINLQKIENQIQLEYADDGIRIPEDYNWRNTKSMGLNLVKMLAENQLDGSIDMESNNGTKFTIKFNIDKA